MATALLLARDGHKVTLIERDEFVPAAPRESPSWPRKGVAHFLQPHALMARGRLELRTHLPDVFDNIIANGAVDIDMRKKLPGDLRPEDADLHYLAVRRPLIEWALRAALSCQENLTVLSSTTVTGFSIESGSMTAVTTSRGEISADVVVDALGRRTPTDGWLANAGVTTRDVETNDCGVIYFSRYYQLRDGFELPDGPWILGPRGDLGYMSFTTFPGDNRTFSTLLAVPPGQESWRTLKNPAAFTTALSLISSVSQWVDPNGVDPITDVMTMAGLRNSFRETPTNAPIGFVAVGDAAFHSDPVIALGLSFGLIQAVQLASSLRNYADLTDAVANFTNETRPLMRERFEFASALDEQRVRMWRGESVNFASRDGDYELFTLFAGGAASMMDADIFRIVSRRNGLLDSTSVLDGDRDAQLRIQVLYQKAVSGPRPPAGPSREDMMTAIKSAADEG